MVNPFDTTLGTLPASWYPQLPSANAAAASPLSPGPLDTSFLFGPSTAPTAPAPSAPGIAPSPDQPTTIPGLSYLNPARSFLSAAGAPNYVGQGLGAAGGLANLGLGITNGNPVQATGGGLSAAGNIANLAGFPGVGAAAGGLGGLLGLYGGINGLVNGGSPVSSSLQLGTGLAGTYGALSTLFPTVFPSLTSAIGSGLSSALPGLASTLATTAPQVASEIASLGGSVGAGVAALPVAAIALAQSISSMMDSQKASRDLGIRVKNIQGQLPGEIAQVQSVPNILANLSPSSSPDQVAGILKQLNDIQVGFQNGGWESYLKGGGTTVGGGSNGSDASASLPGVQSALKALDPYFAMMDVGRARAQDQLARAGWTPGQITSSAGKYLTPVDFALEANSAAPGASFNEAYRPSLLQFNASTGGDIAGQIANGSLDGNAPASLTPSAKTAMGLRPDYAYTNQDIANFLDVRGGAGATGVVSNDPSGLGVTTNRVSSQLASLKPGSIEQGVAQLLQQYGGVSPLMQSFGFGLA